MKQNLVCQTEPLQWLCNYKMLYNTTTREQFWQHSLSLPVNQSSGVAWSTWERWAGRASRRGAADTGHLSHGWLDSNQTFLSRRQ